MIKDVYGQLTFDDIVFERYLSRGVSPTPDQVDAIKGQIEGKNLGSTGSSLDYSPEFQTESSAKEIQKALDTFSREIRTVFTSSALLKDRGKRIYDRAENASSLINKQAMDLALEACALAQGRSEGYNLFAYDVMIDLTKIDQGVTSLYVDPRTQSIRLKSRTSERRINLTNLEDKDFTVTVIKGDVASQSLAPDSRLQNAVDDSDSYWLYRAQSSVDGEKGIALQLDLGKETTISQLTFAPFGTNTDTGIQVRVLASINTINWRELMPITQQTAPRVQIDGPAILARYIRIEMTRIKPSYRTQDTAGFVYEFGLNDLRIYESLYYPGGQFVSKPIEFRDVLGTLQRINTLKFNFYDERPEGTEIVYYISIDPDSKEGLIRINPNIPIELNTVIKAKENQGKIRSRYDANHALVGLPLEDGFLQETIEFYRNTYQPGVFIDGVQSGWKLKDSYYSCIAEILLEKEINLGVNFAFIDGRKVNGIQVLTPGFHTFRMHETNWKAVNSESEDPLFPYNHKLLIEGLEGSSVYVKVDFLAAEKLNLVSAFDLIENIPTGDSQYFGINGSYPIIKIATPPVFLDDLEGWRLEQHAIRYKYVSDVLAPITSVRLVARMSTNNPRLTPVLRGYIALAGF
jgi:hypothetical protein